MKRALKIVSRKHNVGAGRPTRQTDRVSSRGALCQQNVAHTKKHQSTLNTVNELVYTISHYLNAPLTVLLGKVELLSQMKQDGGIAEENMKKFAEDCKREIFRIDAIVKAFQDLCILQHKTFPPGVRMLDVEREIENRVKETSFLR